MLAKSPELVSYGLNQVYYAASIGAVKELIVLDELLHSMDEEERLLVEETVRKAESTKARIIFINTKSELGIRLKMLGGIAAIHRYPLPGETTSSG